MTCLLSYQRRRADHPEGVEVALQAEGDQIRPLAGGGFPVTPRDDTTTKNRESLLAENLMHSVEEDQESPRAEG